MSTEATSFQLIERQEDLIHFREENRGVEWMCFDTEFVGEKRFVTRLCLIQATTSRGSYLIDPFVVGDLKPFLDLITDPDILKITHAGDNDYRLLYEQFQLTPVNVIDTQIAAGLAGYKYPTALRKLVEGELHRHLSKGYTVADWESRPFPKKQLKYALNDVLPLYDLWMSLKEKLARAGRVEWAREECRQLEQAEFYQRDPNKEALDSNLMRSLSPREQVFLLRLYEWRRRTAREKNHSREMVLPNKLMSQIVRTIQSGADALRQNRRIPDKIAARHGAQFEELYRLDITPEERRVLDRINREELEDPREETLMEMLYLVVKYKCIEEDVSPNLVLPRGWLKKLRVDPELVRDWLEEGWRGEFLGDTILSWLGNFDRLEMVIEEKEIRLRLRE